METRFRCPRDHHITCFEVCKARKARKHHGCITCMTPSYREHDRKNIEKIQVIWTVDQTKAKRPIVKIIGLSSQPISIRPTVVSGLVEKLLAIMER